MRIGVVGLGAVGARAARQLASTAGMEGVVLFAPQLDRAREVAASLGPVATIASSPPGAAEVDAVVLAGPAGEHADTARALVAAGVAVVSTSDSVGDVRALLDLGPLAEARSTVVAVGAGFSPGLTCVLARHGAALFDRVDEIHVAKSGTGGPACARQHHRALGDVAIDWRDGGWQQRAGGSGRELCWFPDPVGPADCYRASLPDAVLLTNALPGVGRVTARVAANRRDRLTAWLPMLRPPHPEGASGAVRVEIRGQRDGRSEVVVYGAMDRPAVAAGAVAALVAVRAANRNLERTGAAGLAELVDPVSFLTDLAGRGVKAAVFDGRQAA
ncbi:MAG: Gfo/Idh/MocA family oxidoreductase [Actinobacteria bacterium]|nr:Gfo/Idh/MocA family oxidoreductase [Actinomycetota bacterium]